MKVENMTSSNGNNVPNQFIIKDNDCTYFQSYNSIIVLEKKDKKRNWMKSFGIIQKQLQNIEVCF